MDGPGGMGGSGTMGGPSWRMLVPVGVVGTVLALTGGTVYWAARRGSSSTSTDPAIATLEGRYARGEIDEEVFERRRERLHPRGGAAGGDPDPDPGKTILRLHFSLTARCVRVREKWADPDLNHGKTILLASLGGCDFPDSNPSVALLVLTAHYVRGSHEKWADPDLNHAETVRVARCARSPAATRLVQIRSVSGFRTHGSLALACECGKGGPTRI